MNDGAGPLLFARYAYPPNALGLCGVDTPRTLLEYGEARTSDAGLAELARTFDGAWPYLRLIADANAIADPLDLRVVEAYWVGNDLLDRVQPADLARHVEERFRGRVGRAREHIVDVIAAGGVPHHCFHVFAVYPWLGLLRTGVVDEPLNVLDQCRTTPAMVLSVDEETANVSAQPLVWDGRVLRLGPLSHRTVRWRDGGLSFVDRPEPGDLVSLHWDVICDRISSQAYAALHAVTARSLRAVNTSAAAAPVLA
ncbi:MAG TPA: DUF6390 family protein [Gaiellaceae bacterium]|nr:DUF6390 family protein [Gaiellaceae bacterium]